MQLRFRATQPPTRKLIIHVDGASRGNPGPAAIGVVIRDGRRTIATISQAIGTTTNNQAEYRAIIAALEKAVAMDASEVELKTDSELMQRQILGRYRVRNEGIKPLYARAKQLIDELPVFTITCIPREQNAEADALANKALDAAERPA